MLKEVDYIMALIKCPECGQEVSDRANTCPKCSFPLIELRTDGEVRIKMSFSVFVGHAVSPTGWKECDNSFGGFKCSVINKETGAELWSGQAGDTAVFKVENPTKVILKCANAKRCLMQDFEGEISANKKYQVKHDRVIPPSCMGALFGAKNTAVHKLVEVDIIDSD